MVKIDLSRSSQSSFQKMKLLDFVDDPNGLQNIIR